MNVVDISSEDIRDVSNFALVNQKKLKNREVNLFSVFFFSGLVCPHSPFPRYQSEVREVVVNKTHFVGALLCIKIDKRFFYFFSFHHHHHYYHHLLFRKFVCSYSQAWVLRLAF